MKGRLEGKVAVVTGAGQGVGRGIARAMAFFIPGTIGVQEGALTLIIRSITGDASLGLAVALVRRGREIIWIVWGFLIGWRYSKAPESADLKSSFSLPAGD